jgi:hypothetical protein
MVSDFNWSSEAAILDDVAGNDRARVVKIVDVNENLMNNCRLAQTDDLIERIGRYERALRRLASLSAASRMAPRRVAAAWLSRLPHLVGKQEQSSIDAKC